MCSGEDETEMREHMRGCADCSRHDMVVRRSLLLVRSLPTIELSADFRARLDARLRASTPVLATPQPARVSFGAFAAVAAGVAFVTYVAVDFTRRGVPTDVVLPPVVATLPEPELSSVATPALVATVPTGMSVWPAIMVASQAPIHFVAAELASER
jgi:hypothetical protein